MEFTTREIATGILMIAFVLIVFSFNKDRKELLQSFLKVVKAFAAWKVWTAFLAYLVYFAGVVALAHSLGFWSTALLKDTLTTCLFVGAPILLNSTSFNNGAAMVKHVVNEVLGITALLVVYINLAPFPLWGELILQTSLFFCVALAVVAKREPKTVSVGKFFERLMGIVVLGVLIYATVRVITHFREFNWGDEVAAFALSVWLPVSLLPFIYVFGLIAACEATLVRAKFHNDRKRLPLSVKLGFLFGIHGSLRYASSFTGRWLSRLATGNSFRGTRLTMRDYRQAVRSKTRANRERRRHLKQNSGATGVDEDGLWRDRREFHETKEALDYLFYTQMGLYRNRGGHYWTEPIVIFPLGGFKNLPDEHGIDFRVRDDGQAWAAWRHTAGGFCLGIGGTSDLETRWRYAGMGAPTSYPSSTSPGWVDLSHGPEASPEWSADDGPVKET